MEVQQLQRNFVEYTSALFREKFLDSQFGQLQQLQDESNPDFVVEVVSLFFEDSHRILSVLTAALSEHSLSLSQGNRSPNIQHGAVQKGSRWIIHAHTHTRADMCDLTVPFLPSTVLYTRGFISLFHHLCIHCSSMYVGISRMWTLRRLTLMFTSSKVAAPALELKESEMRALISVISAKRKMFKSVLDVCNKLTKSSC